MNIIAVGQLYNNNNPVSKVIKVRNQITIQQVIRLQSWGYVMITITDFDSITIVLQSMISNVKVE